MKKFTSLIMLALLSAVLAVGCKQDQYYIFSDVARIQFGTPVLNPLIKTEDSVKYETFYYTPDYIMRDTVYFDIYTIGGTSKSDRKYKLEQQMLPGLENAVPGKHFIDFDDSSVDSLYIIKADSVHAKAPVVILRDSELKNKTIQLGITVVANENFEVGESAKSWRKLRFTDALSRPTAWTDFLSTRYFGIYSVRKHEFMIDVTGERWDQDFIAALLTSQLSYYNAVLQMALINYNNKHPNAPLQTESGEMIVFPN